MFPCGLILANEEMAVEHHSDVTVQREKHIERVRGRGRERERGRVCERESVGGGHRERG